ncbi:hypothetical protein SUGI_0469640 [Cryptomeria japonica]|nr:hypothetical protein SUGI_0469640 [Cryptomeria japonica]
MEVEDGGVTWVSTIVLAILFQDRDAIRAGAVMCVLTSLSNLLMLENKVIDRFSDPFQKDLLIHIIYLQESWLIVTNTIAEISHTRTNDGLVQEAGRSVVEHSSSKISKLEVESFKYLEENVPKLECEEMEEALVPHLNGSAIQPGKIRPVAPYRIVSVLLFLEVPFTAVHKASCVIDRDLNGLIAMEDPDSIWATIALFIEHFQVKTSTTNEKELATEGLLDLAKSRMDVKNAVGFLITLLKSRITVAKPGTIIANVNAALTLWILCD